MKFCVASVLSVVRFIRTFNPENTEAARRLTEFQVEEPAGA